MEPETKELTVSTEVVDITEKSFEAILNLYSADVLRGLKTDKSFIVAKHITLLKLVHDNVMFVYTSSTGSYTLKNKVTVYCFGDGGKLNVKNYE